MVFLFSGKGFARDFEKKMFIRILVLLLQKNRIMAYQKKYGAEKAKNAGKDTARKDSRDKEYSKSYTSRDKTSGRGKRKDRDYASGYTKFRKEKPAAYQEPEKENFPFAKTKVRLNKFIANSGYCSRREADRYIEIGMVQVNGKLVTTLGTKVSSTDIVQIDGQRLTPEKKYYVLLNKPRGFITTTDDPFDRRTVMELVKNACNERIYPVGRLDRNTSGLLLFTNDGELAKILTHPRYNIKKIYRVSLNQKISKEQIRTIAEGIELEDGFIQVDAIEYVGDTTAKNEVGVEIHSGKNRIIRRIFESMGFEVEKLDRTVFASLTKKDLPRGKYRFLTDNEVKFLKMIRT